MSSLTIQWHQEEKAVQGGLQLLGGLSSKLHGFLGQLDQVQHEQAQTTWAL